MTTYTILPASQKALLIHHLTDPQGHGITQMEAVGLYRIYSLTSRISELRRMGYRITSDTRTDPTGRRYVRYFLEGACKKGKRKGKGIR